MVCSYFDSRQLGGKGMEGRGGGGSNIFWKSNKWGGGGWGEGVLNGGRIFFKNSKI